MATLSQEYPQNHHLFRGEAPHIAAKHPSFPPAKYFLSKPAIRKARAKATASERNHRDVLQHIQVIDPHGCWMARWQRQFAALQIPQLR
jgi:hypothetical protein